MPRHIRQCLLDRVQDERGPGGRHGLLREIQRDPDREPGALGQQHDFREKTWSGSPWGPFRFGNRGCGHAFVVLEHIHQGTRLVDPPAADGCHVAQRLPGTFRGMLQHQKSAFCLDRDDREGVSEDVVEFSREPRPLLRGGKAVQSVLLCFQKRHPFQCPLGPGTSGTSVCPGQRHHRHGEQNRAHQDHVFQWISSRACGNRGQAGGQPRSGREEPEKQPPQRFVQARLNGPHGKEGGAHGQQRHGVEHNGMDDHGPADD